MRDRRLGWLGGGLVVVGLALIVVGSAVGGVAGYGRMPDVERRDLLDGLVHEYVKAA